MMLFTYLQIHNRVIAHNVAIKISIRRGGIETIPSNIVRPPSRDG